MARPRDDERTDRDTAGKLHRRQEKRGNCFPESAVRPQKFVNGFGEFGTDSGNAVGDLAGGGFADHRDGTEGLQEGISADLAQSGDLIEQGFGDPFTSSRKRVNLR